MVRKFLYAAALAASSAAGVVSPAAAQTYGSVTLSVGPRYGSYGSYGSYDSGYGYGYRGDPYYRDRAVDWRARERWERRVRWERERKWREHSWRERQWNDDRGRNGDHDRDWHRREY